MDAFEAKVRENAPSWSAFDSDDFARLTTSLGHPPRSYPAFARETVAGVNA